MKFLVYPSLFILVILFACSKDHDPVLISACMTQKIEDFKSDPNASAVIQIDAPFRTLYWFQTTNIPIDAGENLFTDDCEWYCNFGCYCLPGSRCDEDLLNFPIDTVWRK